MTKIITVFFLGIACITLQAQQMSNMQTRFTGSHVEVFYTLTSNASANIELLYSTDRGNTFQTCRAVTGDLQSQTSGNKKIIWECAEEGVIVADVILKLNAKTDTDALKTDMDLIEMVFVEGGSFRMGCTKEQGKDCHNYEKPEHQVTLSSFYMGKYPVTQGEWKAVMGHNPAYFSKGDNYPVENVSWDDVQEFIRKLNMQTGKNYRLPTEAEWEYAARGGKKNLGYKFSGSNNVNNVAWHEGNSNESTHPVGAKQPNELGIYDMCGNVWEWCSDWSGPYSALAQTNPTGPGSGSYHILRGGSWRAPIADCRVSYRYDVTPGDHYYSLGFRIVHP